MFYFNCASYGIDSSINLGQIFLNCCSSKMKKCKDFHVVLITHNNLDNGYRSAASFSLLSFTLTSSFLAFMNEGIYYHHNQFRMPFIVSQKRIGYGSLLALVMKQISLKASFVKKMQESTRRCSGDKGSFTTVKKNYAPTQTAHNVNSQ